MFAWVFRHPCIRSSVAVCTDQACGCDGTGGAPCTRCVWRAAARRSTSALTRSRTSISRLGSRRSRATRHPPDQLRMVRLSSPPPFPLHVLRPLLFPVSACYIPRQRCYFVGGWFDRVFWLMPTKLRFAACRWLQCRRRCSVGAAPKRSGRWWAAWVATRSTPPTL